MGAASVQTAPLTWMVAAAAGGALTPRKSLSCDTSKYTIAHDAILFHGRLMKSLITSERRVR